MMPIPSGLVTRFFQLLVGRQFTEARRELERIKERMHKTEWNRGYYRALRGMLLARKSNSDSYAFLSSLDVRDEKALKKYRKEFRRHVQSKLHESFDRGFFSAWSDCMRVMSNLIPGNPEDFSSRNAKDGSQVRINGFLAEKD